MADTLLKSVYTKQALVPASSWLSNKIPSVPVVTTTSQNDSLKISWTDAGEKDVFHWVVYYQYGNKWDYKILNRNDRAILLSKTSGAITSSQPLKKIIVTAVDRTGNESEKKGTEIN